MGIKYDGRQKTNDICRGCPPVRRSLKKKSVILTWNIANNIDLSPGKGPFSGSDVVDVLLKVDPGDSVMTPNATGSDDLRVPDPEAALPPEGTTRL